MTVPAFSCFRPGYGGRGLAINPDLKQFLDPASRQGATGEAVIRWTRSAPLKVTSPSPTENITYFASQFRLRAGNAVDKRDCGTRTP